MAKTVFGHEIHLRLHGGRVAYIPWDEFIARLKEDAPRKVSRLRDQLEYTETVGPLGGFWLRYTLKRESHQVQYQKGGVAVQQSVALDKFVVLPESEQMGEPVEQALRDGSQLNSVLAVNRPASTTITVWTYPDSLTSASRSSHWRIARRHSIGSAIAYVTDGTYGTRLGSHTAPDFLEGLRR
jgi:hypothetical protein